MEVRGDCHFGSYLRSAAVGCSAEGLRGQRRSQSQALALPGERDRGRWVPRTPVEPRSDRSSSDSLGGGSRRGSLRPLRRSMKPRTRHPSATVPLAVAAQICIVCRGCVTVDRCMAQAVAGHLAASLSDWARPLYYGTSKALTSVRAAPRCPLGDTPNRRGIRPATGGSLAAGRRGTWSGRPCPMHAALPGRCSLAAFSRSSAGPLDVWAPFRAGLLQEGPPWITRPLSWPVTSS